MQVLQLVYHASVSSPGAGACTDRVRNNGHGAPQGKGGTHAAVGPTQTPDTPSPRPLLSHVWAVAPARHVYSAPPGPATGGRGGEKRKKDRK